MRLVPTISIVCDKCDECFEATLTPLVGGGWDGREVDDLLKKDGWHVESGLDICSDCKEEGEEE